MQRVSRATGAVPVTAERGWKQTHPVIRGPLKEYLTDMLGRCDSSSLFALFLKQASFPAAQNKTNARTCSCVYILAFKRSTSKTSEWLLKVLYNSDHTGGDPNRSLKHSGKSDFLVYCDGTGVTKSVIFPQCLLMDRAVEEMKAREPQQIHGDKCRELFITGWHHWLALLTWWFEYFGRRNKVDLFPI